MSVELIKLDNGIMRGQKVSISPSANTWICGGAIRQWFVGTEKASDIDVFGKDEAALKQFVDEKLKGCKILSTHKNATTYDYQGQWVQVIHGKLFPTLRDTLDGFDFNVCQFGWDGENIYSTRDAIISVLRGHLGVHKITPEFAADSLRRAFKYQKKGYYPCAGTMRDLGLAFVGLTTEQIRSQVEISPNGGLRAVGID